jgi:hypothetical protein
VSATARPAIHRAADAASPGPTAQPAAPSPAPAAQTPQPPAGGGGGFLVDDAATDVLPGQMRKSDFLATLRPAVCTAADRELARAGRNTAGCPYLDRWFGYYAGRDAQQVERSLRRYAPETATATSAADYVGPVSLRVADGVRGWVDTGKVPALPDGISPDMLGGGGVLGAVAEVGSAIGSAVTSAVSAVGSFFKGLFFKAGEGGAARGADHGALAARLGEGRPLDGASRSRMGAAFGHDFGAVRVHDDAPAAALADGLGARAFTLGTHVAFAAGQHRPGQPEGDALLAHELAHVVQQGGAGQAVPAEAPGEHDAVEEDADASAVAAVLTLWGPRGAEHAASRPRLRSGPGLRRCAGEQKPAAAAVPPLSQKASAACTADQRQQVGVTSYDELNLCCMSNMQAEIAALRARAIPLVQKAIDRLKSPDAVSDALKANFAIGPNDTEAIGAVRDQLAAMLRTMQGNEIRFICNEHYDPFTQQGDPRCGTKAASTTPTCSAGTKFVTLCGNYADAAGGKGAYLPEDHWLKTLIHEYAHAGCPPGSYIAPAGSESYKGDTRSKAIPYPAPGGKAVYQADSYAHFVLDVGQ